MSENPTPVLSADTFRPAVGQTFTISVGEESVEATLREVAALSGDSQRSDGQPFSLLFQGPSHVVIEQQICRVHHEQVGEQHIFLVTLGPDPKDEARPMLYEAVFT